MLARWKALKASASLEIIRAGGTISHQHGVGLDHRPYLEAEKGSVGMEILKQIFAHIDPMLYDDTFVCIVEIVCIEIVY